MKAGNTFFGVLCFVKKEFQQMTSNNKLVCIIQVCKKIQKFFTVQLSWLNCLMSSCCGLEFFEIKVALFVSVEEETQGTTLQLSPSCLLLSTCFRKIRIIPWYCLNCTMYSCMQFVPFYFYIWEYTQYLIYIEKPVLCTSRSLVLYFF